jgi:hypothetical protein
VERPQAPHRRQDQAALGRLGGERLGPPRGGPSHYRCAVSAQLLGVVEMSHDPPRSVGEPPSEWQRRRVAAHRSPPTIPVVAMTSTAGSGSGSKLRPGFPGPLAALPDVFARLSAAIHLILNSEHAQRAVCLCRGLVSVRFARRCPSRRPPA